MPGEAPPESWAAGDVSWLSPWGSESLSLCMACARPDGTGGLAPQHYWLVPPLQTPGQHLSQSSEEESRGRQIAKTKGVVCNQRLCTLTWTEMGDG